MPVTKASKGARNNITKLCTYPKGSDRGGFFGWDTSDPQYGIDESCAENRVIAEEVAEPQAGDSWNIAFRVDGPPLDRCSLWVTHVEALSDVTALPPIQFELWTGVPNTWTISVRGQFDPALNGGQACKDWILQRRGLLVRSWLLRIRVPAADPDAQRVRVKFRMLFDKAGQAVGTDFNPDPVGFVTLSKG